MNVKPDSKKIIKFHSVSSFVFFAFFLLFISIQEAQAYSGGTITPTQSFSNFTCTAGIGNVQLIGQFTNGDTPYRVIFLKMLVLDKNGSTIATGNGNIPNIKAHETVTFNAITRFSGNFSSCTVQIDNAIEK
ncbi:MAG TPA: FxLYD domain-containing protein [Candidatus Nitrosotalea sp.]|nr:FxLYD domain-containing protein [Candidatus Nitrosotalea sp.]